MSARLLLLAASTGYQIRTFACGGKAVKEALSLWEERERRRLEILAAVDEAEASLARGEGRVITQESMRELAQQVMERGRARLASEQQSKQQKPR